MRYLVLPRLRIQRANALATPWLLGTCPLFAVAMLGHALGREWAVQPVAVGLIHHDAQLLAEEPLPLGYGGRSPQQFRAASFIDKSDYSSKSEHALALQPTASAHLELSVVLAFEDQTPSLSLVPETLRSKRVAGGLIISHEAPFFCESIEGPSGVVARVRQGFWVVDKSHALDPTNRLESLMDHVSPPAPAPSSIRATDAKPNRAWCAPAVLGYATLTTFEQREGVREDAPHAFAEPLVGLVEYISIRREEQPEQLFWKGQWMRPDVFALLPTTHQSTQV